MATGEHQPVTDETRLAKALAWVDGLLARHAVPYQIVGGTAAWAYGSRRPIWDIDLYAPLADAPGAVAELLPRAGWGPAAYLGDAWDLTYVKLFHTDVQIEIGYTDPMPRFYSVRQQRWLDQPIDFGRSVALSLFGLEVPVMPLDELAAYKSELGREVDLADLDAIGRRG